MLNQSIMNPASEQDAAAEPDPAAAEPYQSAEDDGDAAADEPKGGNPAVSTGDVPEQLPEPEPAV
eukprot:667939-Heterocapsa_arctica.AAC.1